MLDVKFVTENAEKVKAALAERSGTYDVDSVLALDARRKELIREVEALKADRNRASEKIAAMKKAGENADEEIKRVRADGDRIKALDAELSDVEPRLRNALLSVPNVPHESVPAGKDDTCNIEVRRVGTPRRFDFDFKAHWDLGDSLGILDPATAAKITGARFTIFKGLGARLERAIFNFMLNTHTANGYTEISPPFVVNRDSMYGTGQLPKFEEDAFALKDSNYFLVPTAEVPVTNMHRGEVLTDAELPLKYCAYTACFRAEAGSAGRDTRGLIRLHQFDKVELVKFSRPEESYDELEKLTADAESILQKLAIPYRVVCLCTGDLGFSSAKTYDIEVWMPSYNRYVEISSCSNFEDYQARRMNIKFRRGNKSAFVHTLNGSGLAVGRTCAAIMENYQNADGSITVPEALVPFMGTGVIR